MSARLLIVTQAVDSEDPVLGFFIGWLEELSKSFSSLEVICLKEGKHALPQNVRVHSLGKEKGSPRFARRLRYALRFKMLSWRLRNDYDAVFVHMNEEYVLISGLLWRLLGKRIVLWRNFRTGSWMTPLACRLSHAVCYTSRDSYTSRFSHAVQMPIGIDTEMFKSAEVPPSRGTLLFFGRLDEIKRPDLFLAALEKLAGRGIAYEANVYGDPTAGNEAYAAELKRRFADLAHVAFHPGTTNAEAPAIYRAHDIYVNLTPSGSFDKTIGEAMAAGCVVVTCNSAMRGVVPDDLFVADDAVESVATSLGAALGLSGDERKRIVVAQRKQIEDEHSLSLLVARLASVFGAIPKRKTRVLFAINDLGIGGAERLTAQILKRIDADRFECSLITLLPNPEQNILNDIPASVPVRQFSFRGLLDLESWTALRRYFKETRPDIVVSNLYFANTVMRLLQPWFGYASIPCEHNTYTHKPLRQRLMDRLLARVSYRIVAVSKTVADFTAAQEGISPEKFAVIPNGIDTAGWQERLRALPAKESVKENLGFQASDKVALTVGRLIPQKNQKLLIDGFALFREKHPEWKLAIVGSGALRESLEKHAAGKGLGDSVRFFGLQSDVEAWYKASDLFVLTSDIEGFSLVCIEAMAAGLPAVSTITAGPDDYIAEHENGLFIKERSPSGVAAALEELSSSDLGAMEDAARRTADRYDISHTIEAYENLFREALAAAR